jgi:hypothetical protein
VQYRNPDSLPKSDDSALSDKLECLYNLVYLVDRTPPQEPAQKTRSCSITSIPYELIWMQCDPFSATDGLPGRNADRQRTQPDSVTLHPGAPSTSEIASAPCRMPSATTSDRVAGRPARE